MSPMSPVSNVYYLAPSAPVSARAPRLSLSLILRLGVISLYWRLRMTAAEICDVLRRFGRPKGDPDRALLEQRAEIILAVGGSRALGPAQVIDFAAARTRLRG